MRPYQLSQIQTPDFSLVGYSVAGEESVIVVPELNVCFDIGRCPREALPVDYVLLTHGHTDHAAGVMYYFGQRDFLGIACGTCLAPAALVPPLVELMQAWGRVEGHVPPYDFVPLHAGEDFELRRGLLARPFAVRHAQPALGYAVIDVRQKLKEEYIGLSGPEIVELKKQGVEITNRVEIPLIAYLGDTAKADFRRLPHVANAKVLLLECTFFDPDHLDRARAGKHIHVMDLPELLEGMNNERIILTHVTRRTHMGQAQRALKKTLPKETLEKITFFMSREHIEDE